MMRENKIERKKEREREDKELGVRMKGLFETKLNKR